ncbi:MAG: hypothetical protein Q8O60_00895, partial [Deltaproteobacteria bacterium]|nr:hypothetical protein [Deltaproteobacteria bacterium]
SVAGASGTASSFFWQPTATAKDNAITSTRRKDKNLRIPYHLFSFTDFAFLNDYRQLLTTYYFFRQNLFLKF